MSTPERQQDEDSEKEGGYGGVDIPTQGPEGAELTDFEPKPPIAPSDEDADAD